LELPDVCGSSLLKPEVASSGFSIYVLVIIADWLPGHKKYRSASKLPAKCFNRCEMNKKNNKDFFKNLFGIKFNYMGELNSQHNKNDNIRIDISVITCNLDNSKPKKLTFAVIMVCKTHESISLIFVGYLQHICNRTMLRYGINTIRWWQGRIVTLYSSTSNIDNLCGTVW
jgi:hypothetical protein